MAKVILHPIGAPVEEIAEEKTYRDNLERMERLNTTLFERREEVRQGWGPSYVERVHAKGKLTTWERIEVLKDPDSAVFPVNTFVNYGITFGDPPRTSPAAGVITAFVRIHGRLTVVIANDNTVASGSWWPMTPEKIERAQEMALRLRVPVIYLVDCSGLFLPEQSRTFPGKLGAGYIFKMNALLSAGGVPQIAGVLGDCIAGGGYMPIISDKLFMTEQAYMVIAGAALVKGGKSQTITSLSIGGADIHVHLSNCADERVPDDRTMIARIRQEIAKLPTSAAGYYRHAFDPAPPRFSPRELGGLVPTDHRITYDVRQVAGPRRRQLSLLGNHAPHGRGDGDRNRPYRRALRRHHHEQPAAHAASGNAGAQPPRRDPLPRRDREDLAVLAEPATPTASRSSGCRTSRASTSGSRRRSTASSGTARISSTRTRRTPCR